MLKDIEKWRVLRNSKGTDCLIIRVNQGVSSMLTKGANERHVTNDFILKNYTPSPTTIKEFLSKLAEGDQRYRQAARAASKQYEEDSKIKIALKSSHKVELNSRMYRLQAVIYLMKIAHEKGLNSNPLSTEDIKKEIGLYNSMNKIII